MIGKLSNKMVESIMETLPVEFSVIDENDKVLTWNKHETRIFKRPKGVIGKDVRDCHPKDSLHKVQKLLDEMKNGTRENARFWIDLSIPQQAEKQKIMIEYFALRDLNSKYLGCLEVSQNITEIQSLTGQKRLLD